VDHTPWFIFGYKNEIGMNRIISIYLLTLIVINLSCNSQAAKKTDQCTGIDDCCEKKSRADNDSLAKPFNKMKSNVKSKEIVCKLTSPEMQKRKATVLASLKNKILDKQDTSNGYKYKFENTDDVIDELVVFIKTERQCCDFFTFSLLISDDGFAWLSITGPDGVKEFIKMEMDL
jgi:hypothetical protein